MGRVQGLAIGLSSTILRVLRFRVVVVFFIQRVIPPAGRTTLISPTPSGWGPAHAGRIREILPEHWENDGTPVFVLSDLHRLCKSAV